MSALGQEVLWIHERIFMIIILKILHTMQVLLFSEQIINVLKTPEIALYIILVEFFMTWYQMAYSTMAV